MNGLARYIDQEVKQDNLDEEGPEILQEAMEEYWCAMEQMDELERLFGLSRGLERLHDTAVEMGGLDSKDNAYLRAGVGLALEQHGFDPEETSEWLEVVSQEDWGTGGFRQFIERVWEAIKRTVTQIWMSIRNFFKKVKDSAPYLKMQNERMRARAKEHSSARVLQKKSIIKNGHQHLTTGGSQAKDAKEILEGLKWLSDLSTAVDVLYLKRLNKFGDKVVDTLRSFDPEYPEASLSKMNESFKAIDFDALVKEAKMSEVKDSRWEKKYVRRSEEAMGNKALFYLTPAKKVKEDSALVCAEEIHGTTLRFEDSTDKKAKKKDPQSFKTIEPGEAVEIADANDVLIDRLASMSESDRGMDKIRDRLEREGEKLKKVYAKSDEMADSARPYFNSVTKFAATFARWTAQPRMNMAKQIISTSRASVSACNVSFKSYSDS